MSEAQLRAISLGAGVQSTRLALLAGEQAIGPMPDCAFFADTGWEPFEVYQHLERLIPMLPFPVYRVSAGNLREDVLAGSSGRAGRFAAVPWFIRNLDGSDGMGRRQCTSHYKLEPIRKKVRELLGKPYPARLPAGACEMWIGISTDEADRAKDSRVKFVANRFPLLERRMSRRDCEQELFARYGIIAPKSACEGCPFHEQAMWKSVKENKPEVWADLVAIDAALRDGGSSKGLRGQQFMHRQRVPLDEVDFSSAAERAGQMDLFGNECEGMCGV